MQSPIWRCSVSFIILPPQTGLFIQNTEATTIHNTQKNAPTFYCLGEILTNLYISQKYNQKEAHTYFLKKGIMQTKKPH